MDPSSIMMAQMAIGVVQMLTSSGGDSGRLLALQVQMLLQISRQLDLIQKTLTKILEDLSEIKRILGTVPQDTVVELFRAEIVGAVSEYQEVLVTYERDRREHGIDYANTQNIGEISALVDRARRARSILFGYKQEFTIPIVACALQLEIHGMILAGQRDSRLESALQSYRKWFSDWLDASTLPSLPSKMTLARMDLDKVRGDISAAAAQSEGFICFSLQGQWETGVHWTELHGRKIELVFLPEPEYLTQKFRTAGEEINQAYGDLPPSYFSIAPPQPVMQDSLIPSMLGNTANNYAAWAAQQVAKFQAIWSNYNTGMIDTSAGARDEVMRIKTLELESLARIRQMMLAFGGFTSAAKACRDFCDNMLKTRALWPE